VRSTDNDVDGSASASLRQSLRHMMRMSRITPIETSLM
jgi:hypothetical protein